MKKIIKRVPLVRYMILLALTAGIQLPVMAQSTVNGRVTDSLGKPVAATILEKGTNNVTEANAQGVFTIKVKDLDAVLFIAAPDYTSADFPLRGEAYAPITLRKIAKELDQVVVVGFGTQKKVSVTGAISSISTAEIQQVSTPSLSNAIAGKLPGIVTRQASGEPGYDAAGVYIRGFGTWGNRAPLVLVDGVERDMNSISPQEIESFSVLKDASATAVYGVRGANGVILINTKKGRTGKPSVILRSEVASIAPVRLPDYINGYEYAGLMNEGLINSGYSATWTEEELEKFRTGSDPYIYPNVSWLDSILRRNSLQTIHNLSVTGGSQFVRYYTNVGFTKQDGIYKNDPANDYKTNTNLKRYNFRSNVDIDLASNLTVNLGLGGIIEDRTYPGNAGYAIFDAARNTSPIAFPMRNPDGSPGGIPAYLGSNPWGMATQAGYSIDRHHTLQGTFGGRWDLSSLVTKGLSVSGKFAYDLFYYNKVARYKEFEVKQYTRDGQYNLLREGKPLGYYTYNTSNRAIYLEGIVNYERTFGDHTATGMLLYNQREYVDMTAGTSILNLPYRRRGLAGRATYSFRNKYIAEFNFGYNGSENFPKGRRFGFFPSVSAGWVVSGEEFWNVNFINQLKIRASHGTVGNDQIGGTRFLYITNANGNAGGYYFGESQNHWSGVSESQIGTADITWEVARKTNIGLDLGLLNNAITLQVDVFNELRRDILMQRQQVPGYAGFLSSSVPYGNIGVVRNKGLDALLEVKHKTSGGVYYSFRTNFTYARNRIVENDEADPRYPYLSRKNRAIDQPWGLVAEGIFQTAEEIARSPQQTFMIDVQPGDIKYRDINGDNIINSDDQVAIGLPRTPEIMYGFGGTVSYAGFDASLYFTGAARTSIFLEGRSIYPFAEGMGIFNILDEYYNNRWTPEHPDARYPAVRNGNSPNNFQRSTLWQRDGSFLRIRNAEIGYTLPKSFNNRYKINSVRFFLNGSNLHTWDRIRIIDPESDNGTGTYPVQRTINGGVQISFN